uniref:Uncharacterized protein n=1 Tax=Rhizophora mucronata TaxID=61149 RepID=A0A2P2PM62_RHIMU
MKEARLYFLQFHMVSDHPSSRVVSIEVFKLSIYELSQIIWVLIDVFVCFFLRNY